MQYIVANYPHRPADLAALDDPDTTSPIELLVWHTGNGYYDPGDCFDDTVAPAEDGGDATGYSTKMHQVPGSATLFTTLEPGTDQEITDEAPWYAQFWENRYGPYGPPPDPQAPDVIAPPWPTDSPNVPAMRQWTPDEPNPPEAGGDQRRWFAANMGGWWGNGIGTFDDPYDYQLSGTSDAESDVLPEEAWGYYDGWVEHDDLASSKYHTAGDQRLGEITSPFDDLNGRGDPAIAGSDLGTGDPSAASLGGDGKCRAGGPLAVLGHGFDNFDAANVLTLELLTWRTDGTCPSYGVSWDVWQANDDDTMSGGSGSEHPYAGFFAGQNGFNVDLNGTPLDPTDDLPLGLGFRDYNLDGMVDQGEVRPQLSENYSHDSKPGTLNNGTQSSYPFNRIRMIQDLVAATDRTFDYDTFIDPNAMRAVMCGMPDAVGAFDTVQGVVEEEGEWSKAIPVQGYVSGIILAPEDSWEDANHFPYSPTFYPIHNEDNSDPQFMYPDWGTEPYNSEQQSYSLNLKFHDLPMKIGGRGPFPSATAYAAHEYGHSWEHFPDTYDYDLLRNPNPGTEINVPMGEFDLMAGARGEGAMVHFIPSMKAGLDGGCTDWISPIDLTTMLTPGVDTRVTLPPCEFIRDSYYYVENEIFEAGQRHERLWFWAAHNQGMDATLPGHGMIIVHTDKGPNFDADPAQQRHAPFGWKIVQADGLNEMDDGDSYGGPDDVWPGSTLATEFNCWSNPASRWYNQNQCTGISFSNVELEAPIGPTYPASGAVIVTFNWMPVTIPSLTFVQPGGGDSVNGIYEVRFRATDLYGGTWIRLFYTDDPTDFSIAEDGSNFIGAYRKTYSGTNQAHTAVDWDISDVPDGEYWVFAELIAGPGEDGFEAVMTVPKAGRDNQGDGFLDITGADIDASMYVWGSLILFGEVINQDTGEVLSGARENMFSHMGLDFTAPDPQYPDLGVQVGDVLTIIDAAGRSLSREITEISDDGTVLFFEDDPLPPADEAFPVFGEYVISRGPGSARLETWKLECAGGDTWHVTSSLTQPEPDEGESMPAAFITHTGEAYSSVTGNISFTIVEGDRPFHAGDTFVFVTTGLTALSRSTQITAGIVSARPVAVIEAGPLVGEPPLTVSFEGRGSIEPQGLPLTYLWDFGDDSATVTTSTATHEYPIAGTYTATLRVSNPDGVFDVSAVDIIVYNNEPNAEFVADPTNGQVPLEVEFDASMSSDQTDEREALTFQWDFGDGHTANANGDVGEEFMIVNHNYIEDEDGRRCSTTNPCTFVVTLTVTDSGGRTDVATTEILAGNTAPVADVFTSRTTGSEPLVVVFDASRSRDLEGDTLTVVWNFGDGSATETHPATEEVEHIYQLRTDETRSTYRPTAVISDPFGGSSTWNGVNITVSEPGEGDSTPRAKFTLSPNPPVLGEAFTVDAGESFDRPTDGSGAITNYAWDFDDGSGVVSGDKDTAEVVEHTYTEPGDYDIRLVVTDNEDPANTAMYTLSVTIEGDGEDEDGNVAPIPYISANVTTGVAGVTEFTFDATGSRDTDGDPITYRWVLVGVDTDEYDQTDPVISYTYDEPGTYRVRLTVKDDKNAAADTSLDIRVEENTGNRAPVPYIATGLRTGPAPLTLQFDGTLSSDPDGDPLTFSWEVRESTTKSLVHSDQNSVMSYQFENTGTFDVTLEVDDGRGGIVRTDEETVVVTARSVTPTPNDNGNDNIDDDAEYQVPNSADQRPGFSFCGLGMVMAMFGSLLGLFAMMAGRRRMIR